MKKTLESLANLVEGTLQGRSSCEIQGVASLEHAKVGDIAFLLNPDHKTYLATTQASAVVLNQMNAQERVESALILVDDVRLAMAKILKVFAPTSADHQAGIHPTAVIAPCAVISKTASIGAHCVIGENCVVGARTRLDPGVVLQSHVKIGQDCYIKSGAVLGGEGFGFTQDQGEWIRMPHLAGVLIGDHVNIGSNTTIDRGLIEDTKIDSKVIIDNLVQIAHNVHIGEKTAIAGCVGIAGSTKIGKRCLIGGGAGLAGHLTITDDVHITGTTAIHRSIDTPGIYSSGLPAATSGEWRRNIVRFQSLDRLAKRVQVLENLVKDLETQR